MKGMRCLVNQLRLLWLPPSNAAAALEMWGYTERSMPSSKNGSGCVASSSMFPSLSKVRSCLLEGWSAWAGGVDGGGGRGLGEFDVGPDEC